MSAPNERQDTIALELIDEARKPLSPARFTELREIFTEALAAERDAAIEECAQIAEVLLRANLHTAEHVKRRLLQHRSNKLAATGGLSEGLDGRHAQSTAKPPGPVAVSIEDGTAYVVALAKLNEKLAAAEAVVKEARHALRIAEDCNCSYGPCGCGNEIANRTDLDDALAAYDAAGGGGL